jgi:preprotein translocase subunit SecD
MNQYPAWKYFIIAVILLTAMLFALPNLFGENPAVQIASGYASNLEVTPELQTQVTDILKAEQLPLGEMDLADQRLMIRYDDTEDQLKVYSALQNKLPGFVVAQNLAPATPDWLTSLGALPMYLGLDLRGGVHFLMEVDMATALKQDDERYIDEFRTLMRENKLRYRRVERRATGGVEIVFNEAGLRDQALAAIENQYSNELQIEAKDNAEAFSVLTQYTDQALREARATAIEQNITTLRNRVNELGVAEPVIQRQGDDRIVVQLPGVQDTARAKEILGATATLEFRLVGEPGPNSREYPRREDIGGGTEWLKRQVIVTGNQINHAATTFDQRAGQPAVAVRLDNKGAKKMNDTTKRNIGKPMAVVFIEHKIDKKEVDGEIIKTKRIVEEVINVATIQDQFSKNFQITGLSLSEANNLSLLLRAGALKAPIEIVEERTIGPSLGKESIQQGFNSIVVGFILVMLFMAWRYRVFGLVADVVLFLNIVILVALLSMLQATLTLPGIAGILLTVGMAVDANVLIFERIREELRNGMSPQAAIEAGYGKALGTIADANITTLIAGIVLFSFGTGPIKGFAITLSLGIVTSMFTAIMVSRSMVNYLYGNKKLQSLPI